MNTCGTGPLMELSPRGSCGVLCKHFFEAFHPGFPAGFTSDYICLSKLPCSHCWHSVPSLFQFWTVLCWIGLHSNRVTSRIGVWLGSDPYRGDQFVFGVWMLFGTYLAPVSKFLFSLCSIALRVTICSYYLLQFIEAEWNSEPINTGITINTHWFAYNILNNCQKLQDWLDAPSSAQNYNKTR